MEKLLEVLIAIGDEIACLSVAELILRHWPSHSRALHVKNTIENSEPVPFAPKGIDKLEPKHVRLKFIDKRKATEDIDEGVACKKLSQNIELCLPEASWAALTECLLEILRPLNGSSSETGAIKEYRSGDVRLTIRLPSFMDVVTGSTEDKLLTSVSSENMSVGHCNPNPEQANYAEEQPHERRSTRLERLRSRKPGKEELDFANSKDLARVVLKALEPFIVCRRKASDQAATESVSHPDQANSLDTEHGGISSFLRETSKNYGAYHVAHLLLEHAATKELSCQDVFVKFLELEKLTRHWGKDGSLHVVLFLAELYYDLGSLPCNASNLSHFMTEASYHLCKIIESVALDNPSCLIHISGTDSGSSLKSFQFDKELSCPDSFLSSYLITDNYTFWARYFWLSGKLSIFEGNKAKAHEEFCISLSLLSKSEQISGSSCSVRLQHLKIDKELTVGRVLHEINLLKVDLLLEKSLGEMIEKEMYMECINLLAPLLFSTEHFSLDVFPSPLLNEQGEGFTCIELSAINILIKACEKANQMDNALYLNCHRRKLQILMLAAGMDDYETTQKKYKLNALSESDSAAKENLNKHWNDSVVEEVKAISQCLSQLKMDLTLICVSPP